nr:olfactory receptor 86 [Microplitis mediator]
MNILQTRHFREFKIALLFLGQWPSQSPLQRYCARFVVLLAIFSIITPKMIKLIESIKDVDQVIECLPMVILHLVSLTKYFNWIFNEKKVNHLFVLIDQDGKNLTSDRDVKIMKKWLEYIRKISLSYTTAMFSILVLYLSSPAFPKLMDMISPLNQPRGRIYLYQTEYFVDQDEYYVHILIHAYMTVPFSLAVIVYFDNMLATNVAHACAIFEILSTYLENIKYDISKISVTNAEEHSRKLRNSIIRCVDMHKNALRFANDLESSVSFAWLIVLFYNLTIISITGMVTAMKLDQPNEAFKFFAFTIGAVFHLFYTSFQGQELIQQSERVFHAVYLSQWYNIPTQYQRLLIPIMMKSLKPCTVTAGKKFVLSMDTFSMVIQKAMSFFTVLSSTR